MRITQIIQKICFTVHHWFQYCRDFKLICRCTASDSDRDFQLTENNHDSASDEDVTVTNFAGASAF